MATISVNFPHTMSQSNNPISVLPKSCSGRIVFPDVIIIRFHFYFAEAPKLDPPSRSARETKPDSDKRLEFSFNFGK